MSPARTALVIDDDDGIRGIVRISLGLRGAWRVIAAPDGPSGVRLALEERPDVVLLDHMMPLVDGPATLALLRGQAATAEVPVVFVTAASMSIDPEVLARPGVLGVIPKPFDPMLLAGQLDALMGASR